MKALIIGCGRVGSSVALQLLSEGWEVTVVDENVDALSRLGSNWPGAFVVGHGRVAETCAESGRRNCPSGIPSFLGQGNSASRPAVREID